MVPASTREFTNTNKEEKVLLVRYRNNIIFKKKLNAKLAKWCINQYYFAF